MKKVSSLFQKISGTIGIIVYALMVVYALGMATPAAVCREYNNNGVTTEKFYSDIMPYNNMILILSIIGLLIVAFYFVLRNQIREIYYVSNFVWDGIYTGFSIFSAIYMFIAVSFYQGKYSQLPFDAMNEYWSTRSSNTINPNTPVFLLGYILAVLILLSIIPVIFVTVNKIMSRLNYERNKKNGVPNPVSYNPKEVK